MLQNTMELNTTVETGIVSTVLQTEGGDAGGSGQNRNNRSQEITGIDDIRIYRWNR